ncbi:MAG: hypothetical protein ACXVLM_05755 [Ilumatobacteraceae bacterium]
MTGPTVSDVAGVDEIIRNYRIRAVRYEQLDTPRHTHLTMRSEEPV